MALIAWYPFIGNTNNQGTSTGTVSGTASYSADGKFTQCLASSATLTITSPILSGSKIWSIMFWGYVVSSSITADWTRIIQIGDGSSNLRVEVCPSTKYNGIYCYSTHNNTGYAITNQGCPAPTGGFYDKWHHFAITSDGTTLTVYDNGSIRGTMTYSGTGAVNGNFTIENNDKIRKNDFRVYNTCLSQKEIREISKGLVCHYPLSGSFGANPNEIANGMPYVNNAGYSTAGTGWGAATVTANDFSPSGKVIRSTYTGDGGNSGGIHHQPYDYSSLENGATYTFSVWVRASKSVPMNIYNEMMTSKSITMPITIGTEWTHVVVSGPINTSASYHSDIVYCSGTNVTTNMWIEMFGFKLEKGSVATPWIPHTSDAQYSIFSMNNNIEYDTSGYKNNGTKTNITTTNETIRFGCSSVFNGSSSFIACGRGGMVKDAITVSLWAYQSSWSSFTRPISCTEGGGWNFEASGNYISFQCGTGTSSNTYKPVNSQKTYASLAAGWHMFTATYDGLASKIYIDGVLDNTATSYTTKTPIFYNSANGIFIGAEAGGNQTTPAGTYFNGNISDVRIYATALSADDIKALYNTPASISNTGAILSYEFNEI